MIGKNGFNIRDQQEKSYQKVNSLACDLKKNVKKKNDSVIYTPLHDNKKNSEAFYWKTHI